MSKAKFLLQVTFEVLVLLGGLLGTLWICGPASSLPPLQIHTHTLWFMQKTLGTRPIQQFLASPFIFSRISEVYLDMEHTNFSASAALNNRKGYVNEISVLMINKVFQKLDIVTLFF